MSDQEVRALVMNKVIQSQEYFLTKLNEKCRGKYVDTTKLIKIKETVESDALQHFHDNASAFSDSVRAQFEPVLRDNIRRKFGAFINDNESRKRTLHKELTEASERAEQAYAEAMSRQIIKGDVVDVNAAHDKALQIAMRHINSVDVGLALDMRLDVVSEFYNTARKRKETYSKSNQEAMQAKLTQAQNSAIEKYKEVMKKKAMEGYLSDSELNNAHSSALEIALAIIRGIQGSEKAIAFVKAETLSLKKHFQRLSLSKAIESFKERKEIALRAYRNKMDNLEFGINEQEKFKIAHVVCKMAAIELFEKSGPTQPRTEFEKVGQELLDDMQTFARQRLMNQIAERAAIEVLLRQLFL